MSNDHANFATLTRVEWQNLKEKTNETRMETVIIKNDENAKRQPNRAFE